MPKSKNKTYTVSDIKAFYEEKVQSTDTLGNMGVGLPSYHIFDRDMVGTLLEEIARLDGMVHDCPVCGESCKQCRCVETKLAALESEILRLKSGNFTPEEFQNLCHTVSHSEIAEVSCKAFIVGCREYWNKLFGPVAELEASKMFGEIRSGVRSGMCWRCNEQDRIPGRIYCQKCIDECPSLQRADKPSPNKIPWTPDNPRTDNPNMCKCGATESEPYCYCSV